MFGKKAEIHEPDKYMVGLRASKAAANQIYGIKEFQDRGPFPSSFKAIPGSKTSPHLLQISYDKPINYSGSDQNSGNSTVQKCSPKRPVTCQQLLPRWIYQFSYIHWSPLNNFSVRKVSGECCCRAIKAASQQRCRGRRGNLALEAVPRNPLTKKRPCAQCFRFQKKSNNSFELGLTLFIFAFLPYFLFQNDNEIIFKGFSFPMVPDQARRQGIELFVTTIFSSTWSPVKGAIAQYCLCHKGQNSWLKWLQHNWYKFSSRPIYWSSCPWPNPGQGIFFTILTNPLGTFLYGFNSSPLVNRFLLVLWANRSLQQLDLSVEQSSIGEGCARQGLEWHTYHYHQQSRLWRKEKVISSLKLKRSRSSEHRAGLQQTTKWDPCYAKGHNFFIYYWYIAHEILKVRKKKGCL